MNPRFTPQRDGADMPYQGSGSKSPAELLRIAVEQVFGKPPKIPAKAGIAEMGARIQYLRNYLVATLREAEAALSNQPTVKESANAFQNSMAEAAGLRQDILEAQQRLDEYRLQAKGLN